MSLFPEHPSCQGGRNKALCSFQKPWQGQQHPYLPALMHLGHSLVSVLDSHVLRLKMLPVSLCRYCPGPGVTMWPGPWGTWMLACFCLFGEESTYISNIFPEQVRSHLLRMAPEVWETSEVGNQAPFYMYIFAAIMD